MDAKEFARHMKEFYANNPNEDKTRVQTYIPPIEDPFETKFDYIIGLMIKKIFEIQDKLPGIDSNSAAEIVFEAMGCAVDLEKERYRREKRDGE